MPITTSSSTSEKARGRLYILESQGEALVLWQDTTKQAAGQLARPDLGRIFRRADGLPLYIGRRRFRRLDARAAEIAQAVQRVDCHGGPDTRQRDELGRGQRFVKGEHR